MKRYLVFAYDWYYPAGGWGDYVGAFARLADAVRRAGEFNRRGSSSGQVVDLQTMREVDTVKPGASKRRKRR